MQRVHEAYGVVFNHKPMPTQGRRPNLASPVFCRRQKCYTPGAHLRCTNVELSTRHAWWSNCNTMH